VSLHVVQSVGDVEKSQGSREKNGQRAHSSPDPSESGVRIAIIGTGISGLTAAYHLCAHHELTLFEAGSHIGGHTNTIAVELDGERHAIDTGFIVFNDWTYPNFTALLDELGVASQPTEMSFSVRCDRTDLEYNGSHLNGLFAQRRNLIRPSFHRMLRDILRFHREAPALLEEPNSEPTVGEYLEQKRYSREFAERYLLPMGSAIWSCPTAKFSQFPMRFIVEFYKNHGLLSISHRPTWRVICGGSKTYVAALTRSFRHAIRINAPVSRVQRQRDCVMVTSSGGRLESFDHVIFACHADQALRLLADPVDAEREILGTFPYERNIAVLHTDTSVLPRRKRAWAAWNYHIQGEDSSRATVSYNMNILQRISSRHVFCVTLNGEERIDPAKIIRRIVYEHPVYTTKRTIAQSRQSELLVSNRTSFCGAYWGNGFHEDGVRSGLDVCRALQRQGTACTAPSTKDGYAIDASHRFATNSAIACS